MPRTDSDNPSDSGDETASTPGCGLAACFACRKKQQPMVHRGFALAYQTGGARARIVQLLNNLFEQGTVQKGRATVYVTGHSQGAAAAGLCAGAHADVTAAAKCST